MRLLAVVIGLVVLAAGSVAADPAPGLPEGTQIFILDRAGRILNPTGEELAATSATGRKKIDLEPLEDGSLLANPDFRPGS